MRIAINHLTRMERGYMCVAGIGLETGQHIRPCLRGRGRLGTGLWGRHGGPFDIASVVDLGPTRHVGQAPQTEDYEFDPDNVSRLKDLAPDRFWNLLVPMAQGLLADIFGSDLKQRDRGCAVNLGGGTASLGCFLPSTKPGIWVDAFDKIRIRLTDDTFDVSLSVTDLRLCRDDHKTPRRKLVDGIAERIEEGVRVIVGVGLGRPWTRPGDTAPRHWLQANNLHLEDEPAWRPS